MCGQNEKTNDIQISVCISVYNGEKFLDRCLDSVISQDIEKMEIVLVDDGSTDGTLQKMNEFKDKNSAMQVKIVEQAHSGLAQGRLTGVRNASGEYVTFIDVDDYLAEGAYKTILDFMKTAKADIYEFQTTRVGYFSKSPYSGVKDAKEVLKDYFNGVGMPVNYWLRWYKRELLKEEIFPIGISLHEDAYAFPCILHNASTIAYIDKPLYIHTKNESSIMGSLYAEKNGKEYFEKKKIYLLSIPHIVSNLGEETIQREYKEPFEHFVLRIYLNFLFMDVKGVSYEEKLDAIIGTLSLDMSGKELERYIRKNVPLNRKMNYSIKLLGLKNTYRLFGLNTPASGNRGDGA
ncbi:MAG: glycosyltransferase [Clostridia bacterium]|nr:glycosyltransferase [Clostridia bacterium]